MNIRDDDRSLQEAAELTKRCADDIMEFAAKHESAAVAFAVLEALAVSITYALSIGPGFDADIIERLAERTLEGVQVLRKLKASGS